METREIVTACRHDNHHLLTFFKYFWELTNSFCKCNKLFFFICMIFLKHVAIEFKGVPKKKKNPYNYGRWLHLLMPNLSYKPYNTLMGRKKLHFLLSLLQHHFLHVIVVTLSESNCTQLSKSISHSSYFYEYIQNYACIFFSSSMSSKPIKTHIGKPSPTTQAYTTRWPVTDMYVDLSIIIPKNFRILDHV